MPSPARGVPDAHRYRFVFEAAPVALWLEDFSGVATLLDELRITGVTDIRAALQADDVLLRRLLGSIVVLTTTSDGQAAQTRVWIVEHEGSLYLRAGSPEQRWPHRSRRTQR